jgi:hypothetical protein
LVGYVLGPAKFLIHTFSQRGNIAGESLERLIADAVLLRLDTTEMAQTIANATNSDAESATLSAMIADGTEQLDELLGLYTSRLLPAREWIKARTKMSASAAGDEQVVPCGGCHALSAESL